MKTKATFAAGCFWGVEAEFRQIPGVIAVQVGYSGGWRDNPTYQEVCQGSTGHAEAVEVIFDPSIISYGELLDIFFIIHDPTTLNQQGPDQGTQYRSVIFYHDEEQKHLAMKAKTAWTQRGVYPHPIVTEIVPAKKFYQAEEYHQNYFKKNGIKFCKSRQK